MLLCAIIIILLSTEISLSYAQKEKEGTSIKSDTDYSFKSLVYQTSDTQNLRPGRRRKLPPASGNNNNIIDADNNDVTIGSGSSGDKSNHYFCGLFTNSASDVSNNCISSQHCPSGDNAECSIPGQVCYKDTLCDSKQGHGKYFEYLGLQYADSRNLLFCASRFVSPFPVESNCKPEYWCKDGTCENDDLHCFGVADCNIQDIVRSSLEKNGDVDFSSEEAVIGVDDPKRSNFCGSTWDDADRQCGNWCPEGNECPEPTSCYADTTCYYDGDIKESEGNGGKEDKTPVEIGVNDPKRNNFCGSKLLIWCAYLVVNVL